MTEPADFNPKKTPVVTWREKQWPVPELAAKQLQDIFEQLVELTNVLSAQDDEEAAGDEETPEQKTQRRGQFVTGKLYKLSAEQFGQLREVVYIGLTRAHPKLTREEFDEAPTTPLEMLLAFFVVRTQSNFFGRTANVSDGDQQTGEAAAA